MSSIDVPLHGSHFGKTTRRDLWWVQALLTFLGLSLFLVYATWAAFQGRYYRFGPYLSPFYSPEIFGDSLSVYLGAWPQWWPSWAPVSAALLILWAPGGPAHLLLLSRCVLQGFLSRSSFLYGRGASQELPG